MGTTPKRETLIALRARRTAHRVASDLILSQRVAPLSIDCVRCGRPFMPSGKENLCPSCAPPEPPVELTYTTLPLTPRDRWRLRIAPPTRGELLMLLVIAALLILGIIAVLEALHPH